MKVVSEQEREVRRAMEELGTGSKQILEYTSTLNGITVGIGKDSADMLGESREIVKESERLSKRTGEITEGMNHTASGAEGINAAVSRVNEISEENKRHIAILISEIATFRT